MVSLVSVNFVQGYGSAHGGRTSWDDEIVVDAETTHLSVTHPMVLDVGALGITCSIYRKINVVVD